MQDNTKKFSVPNDQVHLTPQLALLGAAMGVKQSVLFTYDDEPRLVEIHTVGLTRKGQLALRGYQSAGGSNSGTPQWRLFTLDKVNNLQLTFLPSHAPREGYVEGDSAMTDILYQVNAQE